jgi:hypothetical protein
MRVYVHGNCQAPAIASLVKEQFPDWEVGSYEVFTQKIIDEVETYRDLVSKADIILSQPVHDGYRDREDLSLSWVRSAAKPDAPVVVFPSLFFDGQLVGWRSIGIPGYGMAYQDMLVLHCAALGMSANRISAIALAEDLYPPSFIEEEINSSIAEMQRRESAGTNIQVSPFLRRYGHNTPLFHVINHPCRPALAYIANAILIYLGYSAGISCTGPECLPYPHVPLHASVLRYLLESGGGMDAWEVPESTSYHLSTARLSPVEYCARVVSHLGAYPRKKLTACLHDAHVKPFLRRLAKAVPSIPEIEMWCVP